MHKVTEFVAALSHSSHLFFPLHPDQHDRQPLKPFTEGLSGAVGGFQLPWKQREAESAWGLAKDQAVTDLHLWTLCVYGATWETEQSGIFISASSSALPR